MVFCSDSTVICRSSIYLLKSVLKAIGKSLAECFPIQIHENATISIISITTNGKLASKVVYLVSSSANADMNILCQSIEKLVLNVMGKAENANYKSIAFPAIGCVQQQLTKYPIKVSFVIHPDRTDTYDAVQLQIYSLGQQEGIATKKPVSTTVGPAKIEVEKEILQNNHSSSENLKQILLEAEGKEVENAYDEEAKNNPPSSIISTLSGQLPGKRIFFLKWEPNTNPETLKQSIIDLIWNVIQNTTSYKFTSIAFLAIGCGEHACPVHIVVKTMVKEMK
ncbi:unnamed protein product [Rotaria sp. Silwood1]|nr:unnamed protein product [Rotaria sp. Silwood1]